MEAAQATTSTPAPTSAPVAQTETGSPNAQSFTPSATAAEIKVSPSDWTQGLNDELKGYVQAKGFKDPVSVLDSYRGLEKLMGAPKDRLLKLPEKSDAPEWNDVYAKLGRPNDPKEYKFDLPKDADPEFEGWARENFHKLGLTQKQGEELIKGYMGLESKKVQEITEKKNIETKAQEDALKKEWGAAFDQNIQVAKKAAQVFGFDGKTIDVLESAMGYKGVMNLLHTLGVRTGEAGFVGSNAPKGFGAVMTPEQARYEIAALKGDSNFVQKWSSGDVEARSKLDQLHKWAYPE